MDAWKRDLRWALRRMVRRPLPAAVVVSTLGLGIGASVAAYSVIDVLLVRPLPFEDADRLVRITEEATYPGQPPRETVVSARNFDALAENPAAFSDLAAARYRSFTLTGDGPPIRVGGIAATWNHFEVLGADPLLGRTFRPDEDRPGAAAPVVVLSHSLWSARFGRDPSVLGRTVTVNDRAHTVIGVMRPGFRYPYAAEMWVPLGIDPSAADYGDRALNVSARLDPEASVASSREAVRRLGAALRESAPDTNAGVDFLITPIREEILEGIDRQAVALMWAAVLVLMIAAANVASMVLARMIVEGRETSVVLALGASRSDVLRRLVAESLVLATLASVLGLGLAWLGAGPMVSMSPVDDLGPYFSDIGPNPRVAAVAVGLAVLAAVLSALPAAVRLWRGPDSLALGSRGSVGDGRRSARMLETLVAAEVAVAVMLLTAAGLVGRSLQEVWAADLGVETAGLLTVGMSPSSAGYDDPEERVAFVERALDAVRALPGVGSAGVTTLNPFRDQGWGVGLWPEGRATTDPDARFTVNHRSVTPGFMEAAGTRLLAGRLLTRADGATDPPVALLSERTAERLWPDEDAARPAPTGSGSRSSAWWRRSGISGRCAGRGTVPWPSRPRSSTRASSRSSCRRTAGPGPSSPPSGRRSGGWTPICPCSAWSPSSPSSDSSVAPKPSAASSSAGSPYSGSSWPWSGSTVCCRTRWGGGDESWVCGRRWGPDRGRWSANSWDPRRSSPAPGW